MLGLFGRMTTDDSLEHIEAAGMHKNVQDSVALQATNRRRSMGFLEGDLDDALAENRKKDQELWVEKQKVEKLEKENAALKETAINIAIDRRAIFNTIEYLNSKWNIKSPKTSNAADTLFDEAQKKRLEEQEILANDQSYVNDIEKAMEVCAKTPFKIKARAKKSK